ncbi:MAG: sigma-70 family RNA polymerase sigma factor [Oscillospiraceae bacterium]|nr:sigma-70 family RNA polymerase sigma factor [Oscillospiraceae bacterium]
MTNEDLAGLLQAGEQEHIGTLWEQVRRFVYQQAGRYLASLQGYGHGLELDDLAQCGFLAMLDAVDSFDPDKGSFLAWFGYYLQRAFAEAAGLRTSKRDALAAALSLDAPITDDGDVTLADTLEADNGAFDNTERDMWLQQLHKAMTGALERLTPKQRAIVEARHYQDRPRREIAASLGCSATSVEQQERKALGELRRSKHLTGLDQFVEEQTDYFFHVGVTRFNSTGTSSVEEIAMQRERLREKAKKINGLEG